MVDTRQKRLKILFVTLAILTICFIWGQSMMPVSSSSSESEIVTENIVIQCCEEFGCNRFMMVSTDKAVNPTNVMGTTKRLSEMIMQAYSTRGIVKCSATRFGNVLGSAGSVIPIFKRQIQAGGPVTITDKRIIRYF
jgi:FlaA1/EpsC-like NDP-sugar epimerase